MKNVVRFAAGVAALCWIFAFASCAQPTNKDSGGNNSGTQQNGGNGNNSGGNDSQQGGDNNNGGNGSQQGGGNQNTPKTYTVYLKNNSDYAVTFWYVENVNNKNDDYSSFKRIEAGNTGYIAGITGGKTYKAAAQLSNGDIRYTNKPFYLDSNTTFIIY